MADLERTARATVKRLAKRGCYDREAIYQILDEALICHAGFVVEGQPFVLPTIHALLGDGRRAAHALWHLLSSCGTAMAA